MIDDVRDLLLRMHIVPLLTSFILSLQLSSCMFLNAKAKNSLFCGALLCFVFYQHPLTSLFKVSKRQQMRWNFWQRTPNLSSTFAGNSCLIRPVYHNEFTVFDLFDSRDNGTLVSIFLGQNHTSLSEENPSCCVISSRSAPSHIPLLFSKNTLERGHTHTASEANS